METKGELDFSSPQDKPDISQWAKHCLSASVERPFVTFLVPVTFHGSERAISGASGGFFLEPSYRAAQLDGGGDPLSLELGSRIELLEQLRILAHLATCSECVTSS